MHRRNFLKLTAASGAALSVNFLTPACMTVPADSPYLKTIGLQLYTVRNQMEKDMAGTLRAVAEHGYRQVETGAANLAAVKPITDDLGMAVHSSFVDWSMITGRWDLRNAEDRARFESVSFEEFVGQANKLGLSHLVFGYMMKGERTSLDDYRTVSDKLNAAGETCRAAGIQLCYHNHAFEFEPMEGSNGFNILRERLDDSLVKFELDVFWSSLAGVEPVGLMHELGNRMELIHLKDKLAGTPVIYDESTVPTEAFKELGNGIVDIKGVLATAEQYGVTYCMVEQDQSPDPLASVGMSMEYLGG